MFIGVFANGHLKYEHERDNGPDGTPSISEMVEAAIKVLRKNEKGYFLMVSYYKNICMNNRQNSYFKISWTCL